MRAVMSLLCVLMAACDDFTQVSHSGFGAFEPALTVTGGKVITVWNDNRHGVDEIYARLLDANLAPLTEELRLTNSSAASYEADAAIFTGNLAVAWYEKSEDGQLSVKLGMWSLQGEQRWQRQVKVSARNGRVPLLEAVGNRLFIAWVEEDIPASVPPDDAANAGIAPAVYGAWVDASGNYLVQPFRIADASRTTWNLNADALPDGSIALVFDAEARTQASELWLSVINDAAVQTVMLTDDDGFDSKYPDVAASTAGTALTWFDIKEGNNEVYLALVNIQTLLSDNARLEPVATRITTTPGDSIGAYLAWNADTLGLAWNDDDPGQHEIFFQRFDSQGRALAEAYRVTDTAAASLIPAIVPLNAGFALGWSEAVLGNSHTGGNTETRSEIAARYVE